MVRKRPDWIRMVMRSATNVAIQNLDIPGCRVEVAPMSERVTAVTVRPKLHGRLGKFGPPRHFEVAVKEVKGWK